MQAIDTILWELKSDLSLASCCAQITALSILSAMALYVVPALAAETQRASRTGSGAAVAVSSARVVKSFSMTGTTEDTATPNDYGMITSRRTTFRDCSTSLGDQPRRTTAASCELRLIELQ